MGEGGKANGTSLKLGISSFSFFGLTYMRANFIKWNRLRDDLTLFALFQLLGDQANFYLFNLRLSADQPCHIKMNSYGVTFTVFI